MKNQINEKTHLEKKFGLYNKFSLNTKNQFFTPKFILYEEKKTTHL